MLRFHARSVWVNTRSSPNFSMNHWYVGSVADVETTWSSRVCKVECSCGNAATGQADRPGRLGELGRIDRLGRPRQCKVQHPLELQGPSCYSTSAQGPTIRIPGQSLTEVSPSIDDQNSKTCCFLRYFKAMDIIMDMQYPMRRILRIGCWWPVLGTRSGRKLLVGHVESISGSGGSGGG